MKPGASSPPTSPEPGAARGSPGRLVVIAGQAPEPDEIFIRRDLEGLRRHGWQVEVFGLDARFARTVPRPHRGADRARLAAALLRRAWRLSRRPAQALALLRAHRLAVRLADAATEADLILAEFAWLTADLAAVAAATTGTPWVCAVHAWDLFTQPPTLLHARLADAAHIVACSAAAAASVAACGINQARATLVHHGLPLEGFPFRRAQPAAGAPLVAVGRLEPKKGFGLLIAALARLRAPEAPELHLAGDGSQRAALEALAARLGVQPRVRFHGRLAPDAVRQLMASASLLVLPSRRMPDGDRDGIANVLIEAMALGVPVVTTTAGAAQEIIADRLTGRLVPPDDVPALAAALDELLGDAEQRARLARAARDTVETYFDSRSTSAALSSLLASHARVRPISSSRQTAP